MDKRKPLLTGICAMLVFALSFILISQDIANAGGICRLEELKVIRISGDSGENGCIKVDPKNTEIIAGDCVVWINWAKGPEITVVFQEEKVCHDVARPSSGFKLSAKNCFVTNYIPYAAHQV